MNELMDRLARANPTQTDEPLTAEEQRAAEALLARILADSPTVAAPKRAPTLRRVAPTAGLLAVLALAAVIVIDLVDSEERSSGIVERAVAAVSQEDVIYAITERATITSKALEPGADIVPDERLFARSWLWGEGKRSHALQYRVLQSGSPGRLLGEVVSTPERIVWFDSEGNRELAADWDEWDEDRREGPLPTASIRASTPPRTRVSSCASTSSTTGCGLPAGLLFGGERPTGSSRHRSRTPIRRPIARRSPIWWTP